MIDTRVRFYDGPDDDLISAINMINGEGYTQGDCIKRLIRELIVTRHVMSLMSVAPTDRPAISPIGICHSDDPLDVDFSDVEINL